MFAGTLRGANLNESNSINNFILSIFLKTKKPKIVSNVGLFAICCKPKLLCSNELAAILEIENDYRIFELKKISFSGILITSSNYDANLKYSNSFMINLDQMTAIKIKKNFLIEKDFVQKILFDVELFSIQPTNLIFFMKCSNSNSQIIDNLSNYQMAFEITCDFISISPNIDIIY